MKKKVFFIFLLILISVRGLFAQTKGITGDDSLTLANPDNRIALVIGNSQYPVNKLTNPINDANGIADLLKRCGFNVIVKTDVNRKELNRIINEFGDSLIRHPGVGLFYYSGHGMQYNSENYILPLDADIQKSDDIEVEATPVNKVFEKLKAVKGAFNIIILDACRNNPFSGRISGALPGLAQYPQLPDNTVMLFATGPNQVALDGAGKNSPFTKSLITAIDDQDSIEFFSVVNKVTKNVLAETNRTQRPNVTGNPEDPFYFKQQKTIPTKVKDVPLEKIPRGLTESAYKPKLYILSVGISRYENVPALKYAAKDARDIANAFRYTQSDFFESSDSTTFLLADKEATKTSIFNSLQKIKKRARKEDLVIFYFSGHGENITDDDYYLLPVDALSTGDAYNRILDGLSFDKLYRIFSNLPCKSMLLLDASSSFDKIWEPLKTLSNTENGVIVFSATSPGKLSYESSQWDNSAFAYCIQKALYRKAPASAMNLRNFSNYVTDEVIELTRIIAPGKPQTPVILIPPGMPNIFIQSKYTEQFFKKNKGLIIDKSKLR